MRLPGAFPSSSSGFNRRLSAFRHDRAVVLGTVLAEILPETIDDAGVGPLEMVDPDRAFPLIDGVGERDEKPAFERADLGDMTRKCRSRIKSAASLRRRPRRNARTCRAPRGSRC